MENDQFYSIGLDLIESDKQLGLRTVDIPNDMITMRPEKDDKKTEYTADGRPKDVFSIIYKILCKFKVKNWPPVALYSAVLGVSFVCIEAASRYRCKGVVFFA